MKLKLHPCSYFGESVIDLKVEESLLSSPALVGLMLLSKTAFAVQALFRFYFARSLIHQGYQHKLLDKVQNGRIFPLQAGVDLGVPRRHLKQPRVLGHEFYLFRC